MDTNIEHMERRLLPTAEAANYLGMSLAAFRKNVNLRRIPGLVPIGRRNYFDRVKLDAYINKNDIKIDENGGKGK